MTVPYYPQDLHFGNPESRVALVTRWTPKSRYDALLPSVYAIGNLYSLEGIGLLIRNVLATPHLRHIVVTGQKSSDPAFDAGLALFKKNFNPQDLRLTPEQVAEFYERVQIIRFPACSDIEDCIAQIQEYCERKRKGFYSNDPARLLIPYEIPTPETFPAPSSGTIIRADSIYDAHRRINQHIRMFGVYTSPDSEGHKRQEVWQAVIVLSAKTKIENVPHASMESVDAYCKAIWEGTEPEDVTYRYGHTMRIKYGDQIKKVIAAFKRKPETFRTVISLWHPETSIETDDEPCLIVVHPRIRRGNVLDMMAYIRTNEMFRAWPMNAAGLRFIQERLAEEVGATVGELTIISGSAHVYDHSFVLLDEYLSKPRPYVHKWDAGGNWRLMVEGDQFVGELSSGGLLIKRFVFGDKTLLERAIMPHVFDIGHALFLGREIEKLGREGAT